MHAALRDFPLPVRAIGFERLFYFSGGGASELSAGLGTQPASTALRSSFPLRALHRGSMGVHFLLAAFVTLPGVRVRPALLLRVMGTWPGSGSR